LAGEKIVEKSFCRKIVAQNATFGAKMTMMKKIKG